MSTVGAVLDREERPAFVRFERKSVENKFASIERGSYVGTDIDFALVTPPYSRDVFPKKALEWLAQNDRDAELGRMPKEWADRYRKMYEAWKAGQEMPLEGTPIKDWGVLSPTQREILLRANVLTVEDLAAINDEGMRRFGMGAGELKSKASAWLRTIKDKGSVVQENAALKMQVSNLAVELASAMKQIDGLRQLIERPNVVVMREDSNSIQADDILPEPEPAVVTRKK